VKQAPGAANAYIRGPQVSRLIDALLVLAVLAIAATAFVIFWPGRS